MSNFTSFFTKLSSKAPEKATSRFDRSSSASIGSIQDLPNKRLSYVPVKKKHLNTNIPLEGATPQNSKNALFLYSAFDIPGAYRKDEDMVLIDESQALYVVLDGHRNKAAVEFVSEQFPKLLQDLIPKKLNEKKPEERIKTLNSHDEAKEIMRKMFITCHEDARDKIGDSGCTVCVVWFYRLDTEKIFFVAANAGDARAVLGRFPREEVKEEKQKMSFMFRRKRASVLNLGGMPSQITKSFAFTKQRPPKKPSIRKTESRKLIAERLTFDHRATVQSEITRVTQVGGEIYGDTLEFLLKITRGIGDHDFEPGFTAEPFVSEPFAVDGENRFIIISSDGIFDQVSDKEAVREVEREVKFRGLREASLAVGNLALKRGAMDDLSCIVLFLQGK